MEKRNTVRSRVTEKYSRRRTGCLTCRERKKRCDERFNVVTQRCSACSRMNLQCRRPGSAILQRFTNCGINPGMPSTSLLADIDTQPEASLDRSGVDRLNTVEVRPRSIAQALVTIQACLSTVNLDRPVLHSLLYYRDRLIPCRATYHDEETGFHMLISRAVSNPCMMDALLAYSCAHQAQSVSSRSTSNLHEQALHRYGKVIVNYHSLIEAEPTDLETLTTIALLLVMTKVTGGDNQDWSYHARGATYMINAAVSEFNPKRDIFHRFLTRSLIYFDVINSATLGTHPTLNAHFYEKERDRGVSENVHSMLGGNGHLFAIFADICHFSADVANDHKDRTPDELEELYEIANELEQKLVTAKSPDSHPLLVGFLFEAYRNAAILFLYQTLNHVDAKGSNMEFLVERYNTRVEYLIFYVSRISSSSAPASALTFPLFMAGVSTTSDEHRSLMMRKLTELHGFLKFDNIAHAALALSEIWTSPHVRPRNLDWQGFLRSKSRLVALF